MADVTNVQMGVCSVTFNNIDLGHTKGGVEVTYEPVYYEVAVDLYGSTPVEKYLTGEKFTAKVALAEYMSSNWGVVFPQGQYAGAANARRTLGAKAGKKGTSVTAQLVLHPINEGTRRHDIVMYKAFVDSAVVIPHNLDGEKVLEVTFTALVDETKSDRNYLGLIGDSGS